MTDKNRTPYVPTKLPTNQPNSAPRNAIDNWIYGLCPRLAGEKRSRLVDETLAFVQKRIEDLTANPNAKPTVVSVEPKISNEALTFAKTLIDYAVQCCAHGIEFGEDQVRSAISHARSACKNKIPDPSDIKDLRVLAPLMNSPEGKRFRGALAVASPQWNVLALRWDTFAILLEQGVAHTLQELIDRESKLWSQANLSAIKERSKKSKVAVKVEKKSSKESAVKKPVTKKPVAKKPAVKTPAAKKPVAKKPSAKPLEVDGEAVVKILQELSVPKVSASTKKTNVQVAKKPVAAKAKTAKKPAKK